MLGMNVIFGAPVLPDLMGIIVGHLYHFLTVLHPRNGGRNYLKTPLLVYPWTLLCRFLFLDLWKLEGKKLGVSAS